MYTTVTDSSHLKKIVNIALPTIAEGFSVDMSTAAWVIMAYFLFLVGLIPLFGKIADHGKLQEVFCAGFVVFTIGSVVCGFAPDLLMLVAARAVQGVGASMIAVVAPLLVVRLMPPRHWGMGMGMAATAGAVALVFGPVLGGILTEYLSWHWCFFINVPVGIVAVVLGLRIIPKAELQPKMRFDLAGSVLIFTAAWLDESAGDCLRCGVCFVGCAVCYSGAPCCRADSAGQGVSVLAIYVCGVVVLFD